MISKKLINILSNSGASTNLEAIAGTSINILERGFKPDIIDGNSSGALIAPLLAMQRLKDLRHFALNYTPKSAFSISPVNSKGKPTIRGIYRVFTGRPSFGEMDNLYCTLMDAFTKEHWKEYKINNQMPPIYVATVGYKSGKLFKTNLKKVETYEDCIKYIIASASIPLMVKYVDINGDLHYDGGWRTHTLAPYTQERFKGRINRHISIYSRPKNYFIERNDKNPNFIDVLTRSFEIMNMEISKSNERSEINFRNNHNLNIDDMVFMPYLLKTKTYEFGNNQEKYNIGHNLGNKIII